jgi:DNA-binding response OmpR family regulator
MTGPSDAAGTALVVEDDDQIAYLLQFILQREGYTVHLAPDGRLALQFIEASPAPAIITLDVMLPHVSGFELLAAIRARDGWQAVPVLMLTAKAQEKDIVRALEHGASDYIVKPFKPDELRARVRRLVKANP